MTPEQKQRIEHEISNWRNARNDHSSQITGDRMAALLQELVDASEAEPVAWQVRNGWASVAIYQRQIDAENYAKDQQKRHDLSGSLASFRVVPLYTAQPAPSVPDGWRPFLTDVVTAAGLLEHGKRDKGLAGRIGKFAFDAMRAAPTPAEAPADVARDAALYCAAQRACAELPEGWEIRIELERSAGTVILVNPDGEDVDYSSDHEYMASDINAAIDAAIEREILGGGE